MNADALDLSASIREIRGKNWRGFGGVSDPPDIAPAYFCSTRFFRNASTS